MTIEQERLTPTQPITRDKLIKIMRETFTEERTDGCYNLLVLGCQEANYCDPEDAEHATLILAADAILAALKSPPIGGEREIGAPIDPPVDVTPLEREFLAAHYERVGNPTLATEIRSVHWRVGFGTSEASFIQAIRDALAIGVSEPTTSGDVGKLCERLRTAARSSSCVQRSMAEAKSLRNSDGEHKDLYMWPAPEQTLEGQAATLLTQMEARTAALEKANQQATELIDEINLRAPSRQFNGIGFGLHAKLCTIRATLARALLNPTPTASTGEA